MFVIYFKFTFFMSRTGTNYFFEFELATAFLLEDAPALLSSDIPEAYPLFCYTKDCVLLGKKEFAEGRC